MRLQPVRLPDPLHRAQRDAGCLCHRPAGPMGRLAGRLGAGEGYHLVHGGVGQRRLARLAGRVVQQAVDPGFGEAPLPAPHRRPANPGAPGDLGDAQPLGRCQNDPSPRHVLLGAVTIADDRLQTSTIRGRDERADEMSHAHSMPHLPALMNPMIASVH